MIYIYLDLEDMTNNENYFITCHSDYNGFNNYKIDHAQAVIIASSKIHFKMQCNSVHAHHKSKCFSNEVANYIPHVMLR